MGQSQSSKFDALFTLICIHNTEELNRQLHSCSSLERKQFLSNLSDSDKAVTLLMYAAFHGDPAICRLLVESGAQLISREKEGRNVLFYAVAGKAYKVVQYLLERSLEEFDEEKRKKFINNSDNSGETCLHAAVTIQTVSCIELLIRHGIDINIANKFGTTALHRAVELGQADIVQLLLNNKAELDVKDASGLTPLHIACAHDNVKLVYLLVRHGARMNSIDKHKRSLLKWGHQAGSLDVVEYLKGHGGEEFGSSNKQRSSECSNKSRRGLLKRSVSSVTSPTHAKTEY